MRNPITLSHTLDAVVSEEADFIDQGHKEYKVVFNITDHSGHARKYTVIVNRRHLTSSGYGGFGDSKKAAIQFATFVLRSRFNLKTPPENAAICRGKICEFVNIPD
jgi:hypothetical protein